jgi:uncharacterized cupredoxin-like copper-binding protein
MLASRFLIAACAMSLGSAVAFAHEGEGHDPNSLSGHPGVSKSVTRTINVEMKEYGFNQSELTFKEGETVKFVVKNTGRLKHEFTVGTAEEQEEHRAEMKEMSDMKHDEATHGEMPSNSVHVAPGETRELIWTFSHSGKLLFACNYPGHADLGMEGKITVQ